MRDNAPFRADDLEELDERFYSRASAVVSMIDVYRGNRNPGVIGLRHDCDAGHSLATAVKMAEWEEARGIRSTYYMLHSAPYWQYPNFRESLETIACLGHELGIHLDALAEALKTGRDPDVILDEALSTLRGWGFSIRGAAGHGNALCNRDAAEGEPWFANDEQLSECQRPDYGSPDRLLWRGSRKLKLSPRPMADFGLDYEALRIGLPHPFRCSDSGGKWLNPGFDAMVDQFIAHLDPRRWHEARQLHLLIHPDWWQQAFAREAVAA